MAFTLETTELEKHVDALLMILVWKHKEDSRVFVIELNKYGKKGNEDEKSNVSDVFVVLVSVLRSGGEVFSSAGLHEHDLHWSLHC